MTNKDNIDRTLGVDCNIVVDGKKYSTTVYPTHEKLPEGYRVFGKQLLRRSDTEEVWPETRIADIDAVGRLWVRAPIEPEEIPALIAFLQGAK